MGTLRSLITHMLRRFLCCFRSKLRQQYESLQEEEDLSTSNVPIDWDLCLKRGLGQRCEICKDEGRYATHAAPCGHCACEHCWGAWKQPRCLICSAEICEGGVQR